MRETEVRALAKINLGLDVLGRRENGYHDVRMVMQTIYLYDKIRMKKIEEEEIRIRTNLPYLPVNEDNIAYKAAKLLIEEFHLEGGVDIHIEKRIPVAAGLAGGSADAAAVLWGMNRLYELHLSMRDMMDRGVKLGADVPYCIMRGTALAEGIGEVLSPLKPMPKCVILIAKPSIGVSTKVVYEALDSTPIVNHPDMDGLLKAIEDEDLAGIAASMGNVLEEVTIPMHPVIAQIKEKMMEYGALNSMMSGSGPTVFGIFENKKNASAALDAIRAQKLAGQTYIASVHQKRQSR